MKQLTVLFLMFLMTGFAFGTDYYISTQTDFDMYRDDTFSPGDRILLERGKEFTGMLEPRGSGTPGNVITISVYGIGDMPVIHNEGVFHSTQGNSISACIYLFNVEYWEVNNIECTNHNSSSGSGNSLNMYGVYVRAEDTVDPYDHIYIEDCYIHHINVELDNRIKNAGKKRGGIHVHGKYTGPAHAGWFNDVRIVNNDIEYIGGVGIGTDGGDRIVDAHTFIGDSRPGAWTNLYIADNYIGYTGRNNMIIRDCDYAMIEYNTLAYSSRDSTGHSCYNYTTLGITFQYNEAYGNTGSGKDRGGFDADNMSKDTVIQYNYSHNNEWFCGIMKDEHMNITIRYNLSVNERQGAYYYGFEPDDEAYNIKIYNNTHYFKSSITPEIMAYDRTPVNTTFNNNIFYCEGSGVMGLNAENGTNNVYDNNVYYNITPPTVEINPITTDPLFVSPGAEPYNVDMRNGRDVLAGYKLSLESPDIDAGLLINNNGGKDFWGEPVPNGSTDIGANENDFQCDPSKVHNITQGTSYCTIQETIDAAATGDVIEVKQGTYNESLNFNGTDITLTSTDPENRYVVENTIIDASSFAAPTHAVEFSGSETSNCLLTGFTITGGTFSGIRGNGTSAAITHCIIESNATDANGGGLFDCDGDISNCIVRNNNAVPGDGGGLSSCDGDIVNCLVYENQADHGGGLNDCNSLIVNCTIVYNTAIVDGGGLSGIDGIIANCIIWGNVPNQFFISTAVPDYSCIQDYSGVGHGNIDANSMFVGPQYGGVNEGLISHWPFDSDANDIEGGFNGTFVSDAAITNTPFEYRIGTGAVAFDGVDDYVDLGSSFDVFDGLNAFSLSVWVRPTQLPFNGHDGIVGIGTASQRVPWLWGASGASNLRMQLETVTGGAADGNLSLGNVVQDQWNHIVITWDGNTCTSYIDGTFDSSDTTTGNTLVNSDGENYLGFISGYGHWDGQIDDVRVYDRALSATEVRQFYQFDYHLQPGSPCIDAGSNSEIPVGVTGDMDDHVRIFQCVVDMGAYEAQDGYANPDGDVDCDDDIGLVDFSVISQAWQSTQGQANYNIVCDLYVDNTIDISDLTVIANRWLSAPSAPTVVNTTVANIAFYSARLNGEVTDNGGQDPIVTVYWGDEDGETTPGNWDHADTIGSQNSTFIDTIGSLSHGTMYYFRAYAENSAGAVWADSTASFTTDTITAPTVTVLPATDIANTTATLHGEVTDIGGGGLPSVTLYYGDDDAGEVAGSWDHSVSMGKESSTFSTDIINLTKGTTYYYRAFADNSTVSDWSDVTSFATTATIEIALDAVSGEEDNTGTLSWSHDLGSDSGNDRVVVVSVGTEGGNAFTGATFDGAAMTLAPGSTQEKDNNITAIFYMLDTELPLVAGTYDVEVTMQTSSNIAGGAFSLKNVSQYPPEAVTGTTVGGGTYISQGITTLTDGAWIIDVAGSGDSTSLNPDPQVLRYWFTPGSSTVAGSTRIVPTAGMVVNGWTSSKDKRMCLSMAAFAPVGDPIPPTVVNASATNITYYSARLNGEVTDHGNENPVVTVYWGESDGDETPANWDYAETLGTQSSTFFSDISSLSESTTYYFRTYAENSVGSDWADSTESFTTDAAPLAPTVVNAAATNISFYSARLNGEVTDNGNEDPTVTVYWGESDGVETPGSWDNADIIGEQHSTFFDNIFALSASTTYYFRAYAENSAGVDWADSTASFTTDPGGGIYINFQPSGATVPASYLADDGSVYGDRGNGETYGWNSDISADASDRDIDPDQRYDTLIKMDNDTWELEVPNGDYVVDLVMGDPLSSTPSTVEYQAEDGTWNSGSIVDTSHAGYTGTGFVDTNNAVGTWFEVSVNAPYTGDYDITVRYANGSTDRPGDVTVNSVPAISGLNFPGTGAWTSWSTVNFSLTLTSGTNAIRFTATSAGGLGNTDRVDVEALPAYSINDVSIEGVLLDDPDGGDNFDEYFGISVTVTDGKLTISPQGSAENAKVCYIDITPSTE